MTANDHHISKVMVVTDWKRRNIKGKKGRPEELQDSQSHPSAWQDHGKDPPGNCAKS